MLTLKNYNDMWLQDVSHLVADLFLSRMQLNTDTNKKHTCQKDS